MAVVRTSGSTPDRLAPEPGVDRLAGPFSGNQTPSPFVLGVMTEPTTPEPSGATNAGAGPDTSVPVVSRSTAPVPSAACMNRLRGPARADANTILLPSSVPTGPRLI